MSRGKRRKKSRKKQSQNDEPRCPDCNSILSGQYDTQSEEPYWRCDNCWESFTVDGQRAVPDTSVAWEDVNPPFGEDQRE